MRPPYGTLYRGSTRQDALEGNTSTGPLDGITCRDPLERTLWTGPRGGDILERSTWREPLEGTICGVPLRDSLGDSLEWTPWREPAVGNRVDRAACTSNLNYLV